MNKNPYVVIGNNPELCQFIKNIEPDASFSLSVSNNTADAIAFFDGNFRLDGSGEIYFKEHKEEYYEVGIAEFVKLLKTHTELVLSVDLNDSYGAIVEKCGVKVGCQVFTHEKIKELYEASVKVENFYKKKLNN
jgi:hypothetical protein